VNNIEKVNIICNAGFSMSGQGHFGVTRAQFVIILNLLNCGDAEQAVNDYFKVLQEPMNKALEGF
jgi:hypothetical protein